MHLFRHAGPEEPAPYLILGHPEGLERTGFPALAGNDDLFENC